ncbi:hypothetical protein UFOVP1451_34 [uncultured Caudovirales phage]|uniref:Uncharacterized protein n=1 Tax=uncultured Caudovirales phage TaxID=2100421 RepID=A0A6J5SHA7_9CAUD|nr:hypothetical protein UFOVP1451_34 [uncultured Caudovirales phage]
MKNLKELRALKKAKFERINTAKQTRNNLTCERSKFWLAEKQIVEVEFRACGDFVVKSFDGKFSSYGDKLRVENLTESGFEIQTFGGDKINYNLI